MAPTTRAAAKRAQMPPCRLLELPPEIRNNIYHFAKEQPYDGCDAPLLSPCEAPGERRDSEARTFFGLTQTCTQIRLEYRPLWLRSSSIRLRYKFLSYFLQTFYPKIEDYCNAPNLLQISWEHDVYEDVRINITSLLQMRAHRPAFKPQIVAHELAEGCLGDRPCRVCGNPLGLDNVFLDEPCDHNSVIDHLVDGVIEEYSYTHYLNEFMRNNNQMWLESIKEFGGRMGVHFSVDLELGWPVMHIHFNTVKCPDRLRGQDLLKDARGYLRSVGIMEIDGSHMTDFVVGVATGRYTQSCCCAPLEPVFNQVLVEMD